MTDRTEPGAGFDWKQVRARLAESATRLAGGLSEEEIAERLARRTRELAAPETADATAQRRDVVVFGRAGERYAIEVAHAVAVAPVGNLVPLPDVEAPHVGIMTYQGLLYAVVDPNALADRTAASTAAPGFVILLSDLASAVGIAADVVFGVARVAAETLDASPARPSLIATVLPDGASLLSPDAVTRNARLVVDHRQRDTLST